MITLSIENVPRWIAFARYLVTAVPDSVPEAVFAPGRDGIYEHVPRDATFTILLTSHETDSILILETDSIQFETLLHEFSF
jgi:hypothetical protein